MANKTGSTAAKLAGGLGVAAVAAAATAAYYLTGPKGKQHQKEAKAWAKQAKNDLVKKMKQMENVSKKTYEQAANEVIAKYKMAKNVDPKELAALGKELKGHWDSIAKEVSKFTAKQKAPAAKKKAKK